MKWATHTVHLLGPVCILWALQGCGGSTGDDQGTLPDEAAVDAVSPDAGSSDSAGPDDPGKDPGVIYYELPSFDPGNYLDLNPHDPGVSDSPLVDSGDDSGQPPIPVSCRSFDECGLDEVCDFSTGRCEVRSTWKDPVAGLHGFHPEEGGPGDWIIIDGQRFFAGLLGEFSVKADIGKVALTGFGSGGQVGENRILAPVPSSASGVVSVLFQSGEYLSFDTLFVQAPTGVLPCDGGTPGSTVPGDTPRAAGPHAAGYVDIGISFTRIYYPALCGSVRRTGKTGTWPVVGILHGNGAIHVNYEYLAQLLATWGFVSFMPLSEHNNTYSEDVVTFLKEIIDQMRDRDLSTIHPVLEGVKTTPEIAFIGHSRGTARMQNVLAAHPQLESHTVATVFLGPTDEGQVMPGLFLVAGAAKDGQSFPGYTSEAYARQPPQKWKIWFPGGNHGSFCDHKVYNMFDGAPTIKRHQQLAAVQSFVLPLMQRAFNQIEPFADQLDAPPASPIYEVEYQLQ